MRERVAHIRSNIGVFSHNSKHEIDEYKKQFQQSFLLFVEAQGTQFRLIAQEFSERYVQLQKNEKDELDKKGKSLPSYPPTITDLPDWKREIDQEMKVSASASPSIEDSPAPDSGEV